MADLTPQQTAVFQKVSNWAEALLKLRKELAAVDKELTRLQNKKTSFERRATNLDTRIQNALANLPGNP